LATFPFLSSLDQVRFTSTDPASAALAALPVLGTLFFFLAWSRRCRFQHGPCAGLVLLRRSHRRVSWVEKFLSRFFFENEYIWCHL